MRVLLTLMKTLKQQWKKWQERDAAERDRDGSTGMSCHWEHDPAPQRWLYTSASEHRVHLKIVRKSRKAKDETQQWPEAKWKRERQEVNGHMKLNMLWSSQRSPSISNNLSKLCAKQQWL